MMSKNLKKNKLCTRYDRLQILNFVLQSYLTNQNEPFYSFAEFKKKKKKKKIQNSFTSSNSISRNYF